MKSNALRSTIDAMVTEAIRRILPSVMNEVLMRTVVASRMLAEEADSDDEDDVPVRRRPRKAPKRRKPVREAKRRAPKARPRRPDLSELLDPAVGADFYADPRAAQQIEEDPYDSYEEDELLEEQPREVRTPVARRLAKLPAALREMAEGIDLDDGDGGNEMWTSDIGDSTPMGEGSMSGAGVVTDPNPIRDIGRAAAAVGIDFSRMKENIGKTSPAKPKVDREDARANVAFENARLKRLRERLNGGKPIE